MKVKVAFIYCAFIMGIFGLLFVLIPALSLSLFAISLSQEGIFLVRIFGAALVGYAFILWLAKDEMYSPSIRAILAGEIIHSGIASVIFVIAIIQGIGNLLMIMPLFCHLSCALWFAYLLVKLQAKTTQLISQRV
jgi:hypothetical protein